MADDRLTDSLRKLPPDPASAGFTGRVLARLDERPARRPRRLALAGALAAVLVAAVALTAGWQGWRERTAAEAERRLLAELQAEHQLLMREWNELRAARQPEPVLYLGGNDNLDVVLDLRRIPPEALALQAEPAALKQRSPR